MPQTDTPLKLLVREFAPVFAAWLLDVDDEDIRHVELLNIELPAGAVRTDTLFQVTLADGRDTLLHIEFQGRRSERPMPWHMLDYLSRLAQQSNNHALDFQTPALLETIRHLDEHGIAHAGAGSNVDLMTTVRLFSNFRVGERVVKRSEGLLRPFGSDDHLPTFSAVTCS